MFLLPGPNKLPSLLSQKGFAPIALVILLLVGISAGTILVQNGINFLPRADDSCSGIETELEECSAIASSDECSEIASRLESCRENAREEEPEDESEEEEEQPAESDCSDEVTYCDDGKAIRKTGGYWDPNHSLSDGEGCVYDFFEVKEKNSECSGDAESGDVVEMTDEEEDRIDEERSRNSGENKEGDKCSSGIFCRDNKAYKTISVYNEDEAKCDDTESAEPSRDSECQGKNDGDYIEKTSASADLETPGALKSQLKRDQFAANSAVQTRDLKAFIDEAVKKTGDPALTAKLNDANSSLDSAKSLIEECKKDGSEEKCAVALTAQIKAVAQSRLALSESIEAGVTGVRVKTDLQIGTENKNSYVTANAADGSGFGRVFAEAVETGGQKSVRFLVRNSGGKLVPASTTDLTASGLKQNISLAEYQSWIASRQEQIENVVLGKPAAAPAAPAVQGKKKNNETCEISTDCESDFCDVSVNPRICKPKTEAPVPVTDTRPPLSSLQPSTPRPSETEDTTSETVDFNLSDGSTGITVTVTKPKPGNTGTGQTQFRIFKSDGTESVYEVSSTDPVTNTTQLNSLILKWYRENPGQNLDKVKFLPPKRLST